MYVAGGEATGAGVMEGVEAEPDGGCTHVCHPGLQVGRVWCR